MSPVASARFQPPLPCFLLCCGLLLLAFTVQTDAATAAPANCLPDAERERIQTWIRDTAWGAQRYQDAQRAARKEGYWAAFLYALERDPQYLPIARDWLIKQGQSGGDLGQRALQADDAYFQQGQPWLGDVYYQTDTRPLLAYCWIAPGLTDAERTVIETGIKASARFRKRAMDRWSQTPNLMFKPTAMVAIAGLVTGDQEFLDWGLYRLGMARGGYFTVLATMLRDGGPWWEAPLYPLAHQSLQMMVQVSRFLGYAKGGDWFSRPVVGGGSPRGLMDYFIASAYPIERTGNGQGQIRIASYGDGATSASGDLFLVNPAGPGVHAHQELTAAYRLTGDPRYAAFLRLIPDYQPDLLERPPLPEQPAWPAAPSQVWPGYGLALLRSDESPAYWTSGRAIAVFQVMSQGYGHDHRDKFGIMLHGAGRLLYPDYNAIQYENPALGWTRNSVAHNTVVVDEQDTRDAPPTGIRHAFSPEVKFLATSATGVFDTVDQTRALLLTPDYLLDLFHLHSPVPHTYDYLLHSFGRPQPVAPTGYQPSDALRQRYWPLTGTQALTTAEPWSLDFVLDEAQARRREAFDQRWLEQRSKKPPQPPRYGPEWYAHAAAVRLTLAGEPDTLVAYGEDAQELPMLVARRANRPETVFVAVHEPFSDQPPAVRSVTVLARAENALVVRIDADRFTDYAAVAFGPDRDHPERALRADADPNTAFAFRNYAYLRVPRAGGAAFARGEWTGFRIPVAARTALTVNGSAGETTWQGGYLGYGAIPATPDRPAEARPEFNLPVEVAPAVARLFARDRRTMVFTLGNPTPQPLAGRLVFAPPAGFGLDPAEPAFGPIPPGGTAQLQITLATDNPPPGRYFIGYRFDYAAEGDRPAPRSPLRALAATVGPVLESVYRHPEPNVYRVYAPRYTMDLAMFHGLILGLADDEDRVRLDGKPLFTFSDGQKELLFEGTEQAFTWPTEAPAGLTAHAYDRARWQALFFGDRVMVRMDRDWTQFERAYFTVPGDWVSPAGRPHWTQVLVRDAAGHDLPQPWVHPGPVEQVAAAELAFADGKWNLCFQFVPPRPVDFSETGLRFSIGSLNGDHWTVGFCQPGTLAAWRWQ